MFSTDLPIAEHLEGLTRIHGGVRAQEHHHLLGPVDGVLVPGDHDLPVVGILADAVIDLYLCPTLVLQPLYHLPPPPYKLLYDVTGYLQALCQSLPER